MNGILRRRVGFSHGRTSRPGGEPLRSSRLESAHISVPHRGRAHSCEPVVERIHRLLGDVTKALNGGDGQRVIGSVGVGFSY